MWSIVLLILALIGIFVGTTIAKTNEEEISEYGVVMIALFALLVTVPMLIFSYAYVAYYLFVIVLGLSVTFWESLLIIFLIRVLLKRG